MWQYNTNCELYHFGIPGMKWGHKSGPTRSQLNKTNFKLAKKKINDDWKKVAEANSKGKLSDAKFEKAADKWAVNRSKAKSEYKVEKRAIRGDINAAARRQRDNSSFGEKLLYNDATRRRAGKLMVERNMSEANAISKAKKEAWRNTGLMAVGLIGLTVAANKK